MDKYVYIEGLNPGLYKLQKGCLFKYFDTKGKFLLHLLQLEYQFYRTYYNICSLRSANEISFSYHNKKKLKRNISPLSVVLMQDCLWKIIQLNQGVLGRILVNRQWLNRQVLNLTIIIMKTIQGYTYKVGEHIGKGYSSTVHKGLNDKTGQQVSIKVIQMAKLQDPINQMLLQLEVTALKSLTHSKHVLHLYDVYATRNNTYLITELCEGDLNGLIKQRKTIPYFEAVDIMRQLINGYDDIHKAGFLHRDIKPANVFYLNGVYKYGDFGFAIPINDIHNHKNYNVGSPVYMPPQALKENVYSVSCDIWAIGVIFYQLLKGSVPWRAVSEQVLYDKLISQPIDSLTVGLPEVARKFLSEILCIDPAQRLSPQKLLLWPNQLQAAPIELRTISPYDQRGRVLVPLRQINGGNNNVAVKPTTYYFSHNTLSPQRQNRNNNPMLSSKDQSSIYQMIGKDSQLRQQDPQFKESYFFANNSINYIRFMHRVLKFIQCKQINLTPLVNSITKELFMEIQKLRQLLEVTCQNTQIRIESWKQFLKSNKCLNIKKKLKKYESKYSMFHEADPSCVNLCDKQVMQGINTIMNYLTNEQNYKAKLVVGADYLTTLYQLIHLRHKYETHQFMKLSKIDLIMQGNPYNTNPQHLQKLRKKLVLIRP